MNRGARLGISSRQSERSTGRSQLSSTEHKRDFNFLQDTLHPEVTHTRLSNATMRGSDGYLKFAPNNLLTQSSNFAQWSSQDDSNIVSSNNADPFGGTSAFNLEAHDGLENLVPKSEAFDQWSNVNCTTTSASDPFGGNAAFTLSGSGSGSSPQEDRREILTSVTNYKVYYASVYVKVPSSNASSNFRIQFKDNAASYVERARLEVQINSGVLETASSSSINTINYESIGSGWYRVSFQFTPGVASAALSFRIIPDSSTSSNTGKDMTFFGAQLNTYAVKPYFKTEGTATDEHENNARFERSVSLVNGQCYVASIYAKRVDSELFQFSITGDGSYSPVYAPVSLIDVNVHSDGTMGLNNAAGVYTATDATFTDVGNGWVRCSFKFVSNVTTSSFTFRVRPDKATGYLSTLFYGPQLEATFGTQPTDYNATGSDKYYAPRFDYTKDGSFRGILTEKAMTNLDTEAFSLSSQSGFNNHYITSGPSSVLDPTGNTRAYSINATEDNNYHFHRRAYTIADNTTYVYSVFAKADGYNVLGINAAIGTDANTGPQFDLTTGAKVYDSGPHQTNVEEYSNGWYRISIKYFTNNPDGSTKLYLDHNIKEVANGGGFSGNGGGILLFGSQLEKFANNSTSFIPTWGTNADATRARDQIEVQDADKFFNKTQGTVVIEAETQNNYDTSYIERLYYFNKSSDAFDRTIQGMVANDEKPKAQIVKNDEVDQLTIVDNDVLVKNGEIFKLGHAFGNGNHKSSIDGRDIEITYGPSGSAGSPNVTLPTEINSLRIGYRGGNNENFRGWIRRLRYFTRSLGDAKLKKLTDTSFLGTKYKGIKAAHSLRNIFEGDSTQKVVKVRRTYDDREQTFSASEISDGIIENFHKSEEQKTLPLNITADASDLITNGNYTTDTGWTKGTGWTVDDGDSNNAACDGTQSDVSNLEQSIALLSGKKYTVTFSITRSAGSIQARFAGGGGSVDGTSRNATGTYSETLTATANHNMFRMKADADFVGTVDNVSVKEISPKPTGVSTRLINSNHTGKSLMRCRNADTDQEIEVFADSNDSISLLSPIVNCTNNLLAYSEDFRQWTLNSSGSVSEAPTITDPFGGNNAYLLQASGSNAWSGIYYTITNLDLSSSKQYTFSVYLKANTSSKTRISFYDNNTSPNTQRATVDWSGESSGVATINLGETFEASTTAYGQLESVGDGWYRLSVSVSPVNHDGVQTVTIEPDRNAASKSVYVYGAMLNESTHTPTNITVTGYDSTFSGSGAKQWGSSNSSLASVSGGKGVFNTDSTQNFRIFTLLTKGKKYRVQFDVEDYVSGSVRPHAPFSTVTYNAFTPASANGTYTFEGLAHNDALYISSVGATNLKIDNVIVTELSDVVTPTYASTPVYTASPDNDTSDTIATTIKEFVPGENLIIRSTYTSGASGSWSHSNTLEEISYNETSPTGSQDAFKLLETNQTSEHAIVDYMQMQPSQTYVFSTYIKSVNGRNVKLFTWQRDSSNAMIDVVFAAFDLTNGTVISDQTSSNVETSITDEGNDWYRVSMKFTTSANVDTSGSYLGAVRINVALENGSHSAYQGGTENGIIQWGAQLNLNSLKPLQVTSGTAITGDLHLVTWHDQGGSIQKDFIQENASYQPRIVMGSELVTDNGGKTCVYFDGNDNLICSKLAGQKRLDAYVTLDTNPKDTHSNVLLSSNDGKYGISFQNGETSTSIQSDYGTPSEFIDGSLMAANATRDDFYDALVSETHLLTLTNGSTSAFNTFQMGWHNAHNSVHNFAGKISEMVFFANQDSSPKRFEIEQNITQHHNLNLVTNGGFDTDLSNWANANSHWQVSNGQAYFPTSSSHNPLSQTLNVQSGKYLKISFDLTIQQGTANVSYTNSSGSSVQTQYTQSGSYTITTEAVGLNTAIYFSRYGGITTQFYLDNVKVQECGTDGHVVELFDQSGNNNPARQSTAGSQPKLVAGGTTIKVNNRAAMDFERVSASAGSFLQITDFNDLLNLNSLSSSVVFKADALVDGAWVLTLGTDSNNKRWYAPYFEGSSPCQIKFRYANYSPIHVTANTNHNIATSVAGSTINGFQGYLNGAAVDTGTLDDDVDNSFSTHEPLIGALKLTDLKPFDGKIQEVIIYDSDQTNSRTAIIADQGTYYGITTT